MIYPLLGVRTDFSLGESIIGISDLNTIAEAAGTNVVGITDTMSVSAMIEATKTLADADRKLLLGVRVRVIDKAEKEAIPAYLKLYPTNDRGIQCLYRLLSRGFDEDRFYYVARVTWGDLVELLDDDCLIVSTGDLESVVQRDSHRRGLETLCDAKSFCARFYELIPSDIPYFSRQNHLAFTWGEDHSFEPLVVQPTFWIEDDAEAFSCNAGITEHRYYADYLRPVPKYQPFPAKELATAVVRAASAVTSRYNTKVGKAFSTGLTNTAKLVDLCSSFEWRKLEPALPKLADDPDAELTRLCKEGWRRRFKTPVFAHTPTAKELKDAYMPRLKFELDTLKRLGFSTYFLLVSDLVNWSKGNGIYVGPGRGSVGGSLVAYLLGITEVDPIRFNLLFERFINPDRLDLPDADLDFMSGRREEVIQYLTNKYGAEHVAGIVNYNTMAARSAVRDVGRIYGLSNQDMGATKFVGSLHGVSQTLLEAHETSIEIQEFAQRFPIVWNNALKLEGKMRAYGTHAAGIVVASCPLVERSVVERRSSARVINWDKRTSEEQGLIKLDVLGLSTLDMFDQATKLIFDRHGVKLDINAISLDDPKTLAIFTEARTAGVFQFEGGSVRGLLKDMARSQPLTFDDLVALNALNRPGPLDAGLTESYVRRRAGEEAITYPHPSLEPYLRETFGVICYQEQVMQTARELCGFTPGEADKLRKIMGKKLPEEMKKQRSKFVEGAVETSGMDEDAADALFTDIEGFAGYAFNKSHSVEYSLISYQAAYLKAHYPVEFYTASMGIANDDKLPAIVKQANQDGIRVIPPDINVSTHQFEPLNDVLIAAPLSAVKGVSSKGALAIIEAREAKEPVVVETTTGRGKVKVTTKKTYGPGRFTSIEDFRARVPAKALNARGLEALDKVGAFARIEPGQLPSTHDSRQRDQIELMEALSDQGVIATREVARDKMTTDAYMTIADEMMEAYNGTAAMMDFGDDAKLMVVLDAPFDDIGAVRESYSYKQNVAPSLHAAGLSHRDICWTWVIRRPKRKGERDLPEEEVKEGLAWLKREIELTKPPVIVTLGAYATRAFFPDMKKMSEAIGRQSFSAAMDATVIIGFNPGQIYHDPDKADLLEAVFRQAKLLVDPDLQP